MTPYLNQFKALLWKEYRESRPVFYLMLAGALLNTLFFGWATNYFNRSHGAYYGNINVENLTAIQGFYIIAVAFVLFLPLFSRESERGVLTCLQTKPIEPETLFAFTWLSAFLLSAICLVFSTLFLCLFLNVGLYFTGLYIALISVIPVAVYFTLMSSCSANRLRSFGVTLIVCFACALFLGWLTEKSAAYPYSFIRALFTFSTIMPFFTALAGAVMGLLLAALVLRLRMTLRVQGWPIYAGAAGVVLAAFFYLMWMNVTTSNATMVRLDMKPGSKETLWALQHTAPLNKRVGYYTEYTAFAGTNENLNQEAPIQEPWQRINPDVVRPTQLTVLKYDENFELKTVFEKKLEECFNADQYQENEKFNQFHVWKHDCETFNSENAAIVINKGEFSRDLLDEYIREHGGTRDDFAPIWRPDMEPIPLDDEYLNQHLNSSIPRTRDFRYREEPYTLEEIKRKYRDFFDFVREHGGPEITEDNQFTYNPEITIYPMFIGRITLEDEPKFTPIQHLEFTFDTAQGRVTRTVDAREPGYFEMKDFDPLFEGLPKQFFTGPNGVTSNTDEKMQKELDPFLLQRLNNVSFQLYFFMRGSMMWNPSDDRKDAWRLYSNVEAYRTNGDVVDISITALDFSSPDTVSVFIGGDLLKPARISPPYRSYDGGIPIAYSVENGRMAMTWGFNLQEVVSVLDVSDLNNMKEINRQSNSTWRRWTNWRYQTRGYAGLKLENGLLEMRGYHDQVTYYQIQKDGRVTPRARIMMPLAGEGVNASSIEDGAVLLAGPNTVAKYRLGRLSEADQKVTARIPTSPQALPGYEETLKRLADENQKSNSSDQ
ncbi:MAG: hypothetical protein GC154_16520 [bacterium]|nr:hypothetical protein [bacterium]